MNQQTNIQMAAVTSSQIHAIGYDPATKTMAVQFHKRTTDRKPQPGAVYHYQGVEPDHFKEFQDSPSKYAHFHAHKNTRFAKFSKQP
jgi:hypothetical protein